MSFGSSGEWSVIEFGLILFAVGGYTFYRSFYNYKIRRRMLKVKRSPIDRAEVNKIVEIEAHVLDMAEDGVVSPLTNIRVAAYQWTLFRYERAFLSNHGEWKEKFTYFSTPYLYLTDSSGGVAAVELAACQFNDLSSHQSISFGNDSLDKIPDVLKGLIKQQKLFGDNDGVHLRDENLSVSEMIFTYNQPLYVLGYTLPCPKDEIPLVNEKNILFGSRQLSSERKIAETFASRRQDNYIISNYDSNRNLVLDAGEAEALKKEIEREILAAETPVPVNGYLRKAKVFFTINPLRSLKDEMNKVYVSGNPEWELKSSHHRRAYWGRYGGGLLIIFGGCLIYSSL